MEMLSQVKTWMLKRTALAAIIKTIIGSGIVALLAQLTIPLPLVPITGQTLGVTIVGFALGRNIAASSLILYLFEGICGLPVFAGGAFGLHSVLGPSGGYLIGFIPTAYILGYFSDKGCLNSLPITISLTLLGKIITYSFGLMQLSLFVPAEQLLSVGLYPFIIGDTIKAILASILVVTCVYKIFSRI
ncbi:biotin transport system substrate-specific component [Brevinema andersonii]|uniref:Biotin transporter n=1 Tax=Brevinema andersonii TaxID=34097 RepID=A0A1I1DUK2_BREAD|nr:biotin transporter BioY [Brevinema andersonii]SFB78729.1 biotin transport system substrate-specific component [Brevinema andersonii]